MCSLWKLRILAWQHKWWWFITPNFHFYIDTLSLLIPYSSRLAEIPLRVGSTLLSLSCIYNPRGLQTTQTYLTLTKSNEILFFIHVCQLYLLALSTALTGCGSPLLSLSALQNFSEFLGFCNFATFPWESSRNSTHCFSSSTTKICSDLLPKLTLHFLSIASENTHSNTVLPNSPSISKLLTSPEDLDFKSNTIFLFLWHLVTPSLVAKTPENYLNWGSTGKENNNFRGE